jgi:hypothetical protein
MRWAEANFMRTEGNMMVMELGGHQDNQRLAHRHGIAGLYWAGI